MNKGELKEAVSMIDAIHRPASVSVERDSVTCSCGVESTERTGLANHRADLVVALFTEEYALTYERTGDPRMDNPSGVTTQHQVMTRELAQQAVDNHIPSMSAENHRVERRLVTPWGPA